MNGEPIFTVQLEPERMEQLDQLAKEVLVMVQTRTKEPEEAFIVLDAVMRQLAAIYEIALVAPIAPVTAVDPKLSN